MIFRDSEGWINGTISFPFSIGFACLLLGWLVSNESRAFGFWLVLGIVGQAAMLQLIDAGPSLSYQHYLPIEKLSGPIALLSLAFLALQSSFVFISIGKHWLQIWGWIRSRFKAWQLLLLATIFFIPSTTVSEDINFYVAEFIFASFVLVVQLGTFVLMAISLPLDVLTWAQKHTQSLFGNNTERSIALARMDRFALLAALWVTVVTILLNVYSYEQHPHVPDEVVYLTHASFFANGVLTMPAPPVPDAFETYLMWVQEEEWFPVPPPGWPMVLAVGTFFGVPWMVNPVLAGVNILLAYLLLQALYSRKTARLAILLLAVSPWYLFLGMSFMTHMFTLTCTLLATLGVAWTQRTNQMRWSWLGGLALGMIVLIRPLEAIAMAGLLGLWSISVGQMRIRLWGTMGLVLGSVAIGVVALLYNAQLTGDPTEFPIMAYTNVYFGPNANAYGFGPDRGMGWAIDPNPGHSPLDALINTNLNVSSLNSELFGWSIGSFLLIGILFCLGRFQRADYLMMTVIAVIYGLHFFYYFSGGPDFGARYWFLMVVPLVALTARGLQSWAASLHEEDRHNTAGLRLYMVVAALCLMTLANFMPWRAADKYHHFRGMRPDIRYLAAEHGFGASLVLIRGAQHPDYASAMIYNPLDLHVAAPIYAWDRSPEVREALLAVYVDRPIWIVDGPTVTQQGYEVVVGPLSVQEARRLDYDKVESNTGGRW